MQDNIDAPTKIGQYRRMSNDTLRAARDRGADQKKAFLEAADAERVIEAPGYSDVVAALSVTDPAMTAQFFLTLDPDLGRRPLDALRSGDIAGAVQAARRAYKLGDEFAEVFKQSRGTVDPDLQLEPVNVTKEMLFETIQAIQGKLAEIGADILDVKRHLAALIQAGHERRAIATSDIDDATAAAIAASTIDPRHDHLNALLEAVAEDIHRRPETLKSISPELRERLEALIEGMQVDRDAPIEGETSPSDEPNAETDAEPTANLIAIVEKCAVSDPEILSGEPVIPGTRVPVAIITHWLRTGIAVSEILRHYPTAAAILTPIAAEPNADPRRAYHISEMPDEHLHMIEKAASELSSDNDADKLALLRQAWTKGVDSSDAGEVDFDELKAAARKERQPKPD